MDEFVYAVASASVAEEWDALIAEDEANYDVPADGRAWSNLSDADKDEVLGAIHTAICASTIPESVDSIVWDIVAKRVFAKDASSREAKDV